MANPYFKFKHFTVYHDRTAMKVTTDACLFGAWCAEEIKKANQQNCYLLDIGTGTGLLSLMIAQKNDCIMNAVEIEKNAAQQALENIHASPWKEKIKVYQTNITDFITGLYTIIVSNPPFYEDELKSPNDKRNQAHHSTVLNFDILISLIQEHLLPHGNFYLLLPYKRIKEVEKILRNKKLFIEKKIIIFTSSNHSPFRVMIKGGKQQTVTEEKHLYINNDKEQYSAEFIQLLKDYYLYL